jgi:hypothetical protein
MWFKASKSGPNSDNCVEVNIGWFTAKRSAAAGHCVEVGFTKAQKSGTNVERPNCVEVARVGAKDANVHSTTCSCDKVMVDGKSYDVSTPLGGVLVRDTKDKDVPDGERTVLQFTATEWMTLVSAVKGDGMHWVQNPDGNYILEDVAREKRLFFTVDEWDAFVDGCRKGEFNVDGAAFQTEKCDPATCTVTDGSPHDSHLLTDHEGKPVE